MKHKRLIATTAAVMLVAGASMAQTVFQPGVLRYQVWGASNPNGAMNPSRATINAGLAGDAESDTIDLQSFEGLYDWADNYGSKISGLFIPPTTGRYVFFISADDDADLFLNPEGQIPGGKRLIAQETVWSGRNTWLSAGGGDPTMKRSDTFKTAGGAQPWKDGIQLTAGEKYWMEATHHEGGGGDNLSVNYKLVGEADPANGSLTKLTGNLIGYGYSIPAQLVTVANLTNKTTYTGSPVTFSFDVQNPVPDPLVYVWKRNGTVIPNAAAPNYTFLATAADNNATYTAEVTLPASYNSTAKATSATATLTVNAGNVVPGYLKAETYNGQPLNAVRDGNVPPPNAINMWSTFEGPVDRADNYTRRVSGHFIAPETGNYVFMINTDDLSYLYLNPNGTDAAGKKLIALETAWSPSRAWETGGDLVQKNSSTFIDPVDNSSPGASGYALTSGNKYYIEAIHNEGGGGDNLAVTYFMLGQPVPTNGAPPAIGGSNVEMLAAPETTLQITTQPASISVFADQAAQFTVAATRDGEFTPNWQWYRTQGDTTTAIAGADTTNYRINSAALTDNAASFYAVAMTPGLTATSSVATLTVQAAVFEAGWVKQEYYPNGTRATLVAGTAGDPAWIRAIPGAEYGDFADNYAVRMSGLFVPPSTGRYVFFVSADDDTDLYMNTSATGSDSPVGARIIAQESGWSNYRQWTAVGGGSTLEQKRSDSFTPDTGTTYPGAGGYQMTANQKYYFEVIHHEGGGGDNAAVTWSKVGDPDPENGEPSRFTNSVVGFNAPKASFIAFTRQPESRTANIGEMVTFTAEGTSDSQLLIGRVPSTQTVMYQWYKNDVAIPGAINATYTTPMILPADVGTATYKVGIRSLGILEWSNSVPATLTVTADTVAPTISVASSYEVATIDGLTTKYIGVGFSENMDTNSLLTATYTIPGATITGTEPNPLNGRSVRLTYTGTPTGPVSVTGAKDLSGNTIAAASSKPITALALKGADIGGFGDPALNGMMWVDDAGAVTIAAHGTDIWNASDGFFFAYEQKTGDFDVVVRQKSITKTSHWAKGGLMVRETLLPESRNFNIVNDPRPSDPGTAADGSGAGANVIEPNHRPATGAASAEFSDIPRNTPPAYPNAWVRLKRTGQVITAFYSSDGVNWTQAGSRDASLLGDLIPLPNTVYVGIAVTAHNDANNLNYNWVDFANYNSSFVPGAGTPTMTYQRTATGLSITYTGTLTESDTIGGTYTPVTGATSPYPVTVPATGNKFYRARN